MLCENCGNQLPWNAKFCGKCGAKVENTPDQTGVSPGMEISPAPGMEIQQAPAQTMVMPEPVYSPPVFPVPAKKKKSGILAIAIVLPVFLIAAGLCVYFFVIKPGGTPGGSLSSVSIDYTYLSAKPEPVIEYTAESTIFPSLYRTMDSLVTLTGYCDSGSCDVMISVEIPGFTQVYKQKVKLTEQITKLRIVPPLLTSELNLGSEKTAQLIFSVTEADSGRVLVQDSKNVTIYSKFDMIWWTQEYGDMNTDNILAWMTPESPKVLELKRDAIDYLEYISDGALNAIVGYQDYGFFDNYYNNAWVQAVAIQGAMSDIWQVRYNNAEFSISKEIQQRVMLPDSVLDSRSGICIETALTMASALQSAGMHVMLIFPPGHAQVAVEAWPGTGDYFLIETTLLPMQQDYDGWNAAVMYLEKDEWWGYLDGTGQYSLGECYVLDCDLGQKLGITPLSN